LVILEVTGFFFTNTPSQSLGCNITAAGIKTAIGYGNAKAVDQCIFIVSKRNS